MAEGRVGLFWYSDKKEVWSVSCNISRGQLLDPYVALSSFATHENNWTDVVDTYAPTDMKWYYVDKGYRFFERGSVFYDCSTMEYIILCSKKMLENIEFRTAVVERFNLVGHTYEFVPVEDPDPVETTTKKKVSFQNR